MCCGMETPNSWLTEVTLRWMLVAAVAVRREGPGAICGANLVDEN
jgi:hypothetical protein